MRLCIIGAEKKGPTEINLVNQGKKYFSKVFYAPYSKLNIKQEEKCTVNYKGKNLTKFDVILPLIPKSQCLFGYLLLNSLESYTPIKPSSYLICSDRFLKMNILRKNGLPTPDIYLVESPEAALLMIEKHKISFPVSIRVSSKEYAIMFSNSKKELKAMLDTLETMKSPIYIEDYYGFEYYQLLVLGGGVIGCIKRTPVEKTDIYMNKGKMDKGICTKEMEETAVRAAEAVKADFVSITMTKNPMKVVNINLKPKISNFQKFTDTNLSDKVMEYISTSSKSKGPFVKIDEILKDMRTAFKDFFE